MCDDVHYLLQYSLEQQAEQKPQLTHPDDVRAAARRRDVASRLD